MTDTTTAASIPSILDIAHKVAATTDAEISKADAIRLASFILDRQEQIEAHYEHLRMAQNTSRPDLGAARPIAQRPTTELGKRLDASDPAKQIEGSTTETEHAA